jgi:type IV secretory pathway VirB6-like protein
MRKKYIVVAFSLLIIMVLEILIYKKHKASNKTRLLRCYPSAVMYPHKDANKKIITDSFSHAISRCNYLEFL